MDIGFTGRRTLIVGGSDGIGLATARILVAEGGDLLIASRSVARLAEAASSLGEPGVATFAVDVTEPGSGQRLAEGVDARWGGLDCVIHAVGGSIRAAFEYLTDEDWLGNYTFNLLSSVRVVRALLPALRKGRQPAIVLLGAASAKMPTAHQIVSNVHKAGLLGLAKTLAGEFAPEGIRVNTVCPGRTLTSLWLARSAQMALDRGVSREAVIAEFSKEIPLGRFAEPEEVAVMAAWLASPRASYVTGQHVNVDGGLSRGLL